MKAGQARNRKNMIFCLLQNNETSNTYACDLRVSLSHTLHAAFENGSTSTVPAGCYRNLDFFSIDHFVNIRTKTWMKIALEKLFLQKVVSTQNYALQ